MREASSTLTARLVGVVGLLAALLGGDVAMATVTGLARKFVPGPLAVAWWCSTALIAVGAYYLFGLTQIRAWERGAPPGVAEDRRTRWSVERLDKAGPAGFVVVSAIGGPLAIGYFTGKRNHPAARRLTWIAAWIMAATWASVYIGLWSAIF